MSKLKASEANETLMGFHCGSVVKTPPANAGDAGGAGSISGSEKPPGEGLGNPLQYYCLKNPLDRGAWWAAVCGVTGELDMSERLRRQTR